MKILFVGESWLGSCARSTREALARVPGVFVDELAEDGFSPKVRSRLLRGIARLTRPLIRRELNARILEKIEQSKPDFLVVYKGYWVHEDVLAEVSSLGVRTVNIYPDCSPHAYGDDHRRAIGAYDLVVSTKQYHPELWRELYGYENHCVFVPQGYEPQLHCSDLPSTDCPFDVVLIATYRPEYGRLMEDFAKSLEGQSLRVAIGGNGWQAVRDTLPGDWVFWGGRPGRAYVSGLRAGKICIAPLSRDVVINGQRQPGDVDTTRTYEIPAAYCFFIHQRTDYVNGLYRDIGVPMFDDGKELARHVLHYLERPEERAQIAAAAHERAVPAFSSDARAMEIVRALETEYRHGAH